VIELADSEDTLTLFTEGIAGRYYHIKATAEFNPLRLELDPDRGTLTPDTIYLPEALDYAEPAGYRVLAMEQLGFREFGSYRFTLEKARQAIPQLAELTAPERSIRESDLATFYRHVEHPALLQRLHACCEKHRVLACLNQRYPGFHRLQQPFAAHRHLRRLDAEFLPSPLMAFTDALERYVDGVDAGFSVYAEVDDLLSTACGLIAARCGLSSDIYSAAGCALEIYQRTVALLLPEAYPDGAVNAEVGVEDWMQREARLEDWKEALEEMDSRMQVEIAPGTELDAETAEGLEGGDMRQENVELRILKNERDNLARKLEMEKSAIRDALGAARPLARSYRYDEWDYTSRRYLRHWCRLFEEPLGRGTEGADIPALKQVIRRHAAGVLKRFEQIKPLGYQRVSKVADGDELDLNAVILARQDIRAGKSPDERVYSRRERVHRDVCAVFLVDLSASTDDPIDPPEPAVYDEDEEAVFNLRDPYEDVVNVDHEVAVAPPARRIIDLQRESMVVMATALEHLGDSYGIYGFSGYGRDCVEFFVAKEPDEAFTPATLEAIAGMTPKRSTRMGPAIRHATHKLMSSGHAMKLLIVLSDGFPQDCDYGPERGEHHYGLMDTAKSLEEAQKKGVETFCVTVDKSGHDYLKQMCPDSRYLVIEEIEDLPEALSKVYQTLAGR